MPEPIQTPTAKAASIIKCFQTTIDKLDGNQSPQSSNPSPAKKDLPEITQKRKSISSASPRGAPLLNQIKRNLATHGSRVTPSVEPEQRLHPEIKDTPSSTDSDTRRNSLILQGMVEVDQAGELLQEQATSNLDPPIDPPSVLLKPSSPVELSDDLKTAPTDQPLNVSKQSPINQLSNGSKKPSGSQPSDVLKTSNLTRSTSTAKPPVRNSNVIKPQPTRASLVASTRSHVKPTIPPDTRRQITKSNNLSASTAAPRANLVSGSRQSVISHKNASLNASTAAPRVKAQDPQALSTSQSTIPANKSTPVKVLRKPPVGAATPPKNMSSLRTTAKISTSSNLAKVDEPATGTSAVSRVRTSLRPVKEPSKTAPVKPGQPATNHSISNTVTVKTKSSPLTSIDANKKPINPAPAKTTRRISVTDSKPLKIESKSRSVANTASTPSKKVDQKPAPRVRVSVAPSTVNIKKPINPKLTALSSDKQPITTSSKLRRSTTANKTLDLKLSSSRNRSTFVKAAAPTATTKATNLSTAGASGALSTESQVKSVTRSEELPLSLTKEQPPKSENQDSSLAEPEPLNHSHLDETQEQENEANQVLDQNKAEKQTISVESGGNDVVSVSRDEEHDSHYGDQDKPASVVKELPPGDLNEDVAEANPVGEPEFPSDSQLENHSRAVRLDEQDDGETNQVVDQNQVDEQAVSEEPEVDKFVGESKLEEYNPQHVNQDRPASAEKALPPTGINEDDTQAMSVGETEPSHRPQLEDEDLATRSAEQEHKDNQFDRTEKETVLVNSKAHDLESHSQFENRDCPASFKKELISKELNQNQAHTVVEPKPTISSQLQDQEIATSLVEQENQHDHLTEDQVDEKRAQVDSEVDDLRDKSKPETPSQLEDQDQPTSPPKEPTIESTIEDQTEAKPVAESETLIDSLIGIEKHGAVSDWPINTANQLDDQHQVKEEIISPKSEPADLAEESTFETHSQGEDKDLISTSAKQIDTSQSMEEHHVNTEFIPTDIQEVAGCLDTKTTEKDADLWDTEHREEYEVAANFETSGKESKNLGGSDACNVHRDEPSDGERYPVIAQIGQEDGNQIQTEEEKHSPKFVVTKTVHELIPNSQELPDKQERSPKSEETGRKTHPNDFEDRAEKEIIPSKIQTSESVDESQPAQITDEDQALEHRKNEIEAHQYITENPVESVGESQLELDSESVDQDEVMRSETPQSEASQFVYYAKPAEQDTTSLNPELDHTSVAQLTPESEANQFIYYNNQVEQGLTAVVPESKDKSFVETVLNTTEISKLPMNPSFDASSTLANDQPIPKNEELDPLGSAKLKSYPDDALVELGEESEPVVFQTLASISEGLGNEADPLNIQHQEKKKIDSLIFQDESSIAESHFKSHSQLDEQDQSSSTSESEEFDLNQIVNQRASMLNMSGRESNVAELPVEQTNNHDLSRSKEHQNSHDPFGIQSLTDAGIIRKTSSREF